MISQNSLIVKYILYADASTLSTCVPGFICINADKTKYKLFSYNKNVNFPDISVGNNTINETSAAKFLGIHLLNDPSVCSHNEF